MVARCVSLFLLLLLIVLLAGCSLASPAPIGTSRPLQQQPSAAQPISSQPAQLPTRRPSAAAGASLYQEKCVRCHGASGHGDGTMAAQIQAQFNSPVADLTSDVVSRARTPEEWYDIVSNGRMQNGMPGFAGSLDVDQRWDVIAYAWSLAASPQQIERGKQVYAAQCVQCHGESGKGDGKDAAKPLPNLGDFTVIAKTAPGLWDQALASGHVPSFAGTVSEADLRAVIDYVRTFAYDSTSQAPSPATTPNTTTGSVPPNQAPPAAPKAVTGYVLNATAGGSVPRDLKVVFEYQRSADNTIISQTVPLDAQGHFVVTDTQMSHGDVMRARTEYNAITYFSEVVPVGVTATLPITIYERTTDASHVRADVLHVIVQPTDTGLTVNEVYVLSNALDRVVANPGQAVLHVGLPQGASQITADPNLPSDVLVPKGDGLDFFGSLPASSQGTQSIAFSYVLPKGSTQLDRVTAFPIDTMNLLVQGDPQAIQVTGPQLAAQGVRDFEGQTYQLFQASQLTPGQAVLLKVSPPGPVLDSRLIFVLLGSVLIVAGIVGLVLWQRNQKKRVVVDSVAAQRDSLIDQIAALDDGFAAGQIGEVDYQARRAKLKDQLLQLMEED